MGMVNASAVKLRNFVIALAGVFGLFDGGDAYEPQSGQHWLGAPRISQAKRRRLWRRRVK